MGHSQPHPYPHPPERAPTAKASAWVVSEHSALHTCQLRHALKEDAKNRLVSCDCWEPHIPGPGVWWHMPWGDPTVGVPVFSLQRGTQARARCVGSGIWSPRPVQR